MVNFASHTAVGPAIFDLGSNTVLLLVLDMAGKTRVDEARITRLGHRVFETGSLSLDSITRTREALVELGGLARSIGAEPLIGIGTEALRRAADGSAFLESLVAEGLLDQALLLDGLDEARYALAPHRSADESVGVVDVGGGSTELAWLDSAGDPRCCSLPLGSVRLAEAAGEDRGALAAAFEAVQPELNALRPHGIDGVNRVVAVAGTATTLAAMEFELEPYDAERVEGVSFDRSLLQRWIHTLEPMGFEARCRLPGLEAGRADLIVTGLAILEFILGWLETDAFSISGRGMRYGAALDWLARGRLV